MDGHAQPRGGLTRLDDSAYNSRLVGMFFAVLGTVSVVAISAAIIVSALVGQPAGMQLHGMSGMTALVPTAPAPGVAQGSPAPGVGQNSRAPGVRSVLHVTIAGSVAKGSDGKLHDAFSNTNYAVRVGQPISLVIDNTDSAPHTITAPAAGVNITVRQGIHTYTMVVHRAGRFLWFCALPCDTDAHGWAMSKRAS